MNPFFRFLTLVFVVCAVFSANAESLSPAQLLSQQLAPMRTLTAEFDQRITDAEGSILQEASGLLTVKRPRHFYWQTRQPYEHLVVTNGTVLWLYDVDLEQITRQAFTADLDQAPALLLSGEIEEIDKQYTISLEETEEGSTAYRLMPNIAEALFSELLIRFDNDVLSLMVLRDSFAQVTTITFTNTELNVNVDDALFEFVPPEGIDVMTDGL